MNKVVKINIIYGSKMNKVVKINIIYGSKMNIM